MDTHDEGSPDPLRGDGWTQTYSGARFYPMDPRPEEIDIVDIAHALSMVCRFNGQIATFYSVAQHSVEACRSAPREIKLAALLHDASEAYICDVPRPLKALLPGYKEAEARIMAAVGQRFGVPLEQFGDPRLKSIDNRLLATEAIHLLSGGPRGWSWDPAEWAFSDFTPPLSPSEAEREFLHCFHTLAA